VFTGSVYHAQRDSIQRLCDAVGQMPDGRVRFEIYTHTPIESLHLDIGSPNIWVGRRPREDMPGIQAGADILFLPLSFHSVMRSVVETALPAKYVEYLMSSVPILVHAPSWSWLAQLARVEGFAHVVDRDDVQALAEAVETLASDKALAAGLSTKAGQLARRHDHVAVSTEFAELLTSA
jgi:glycosyltransferase involved in cell wall biosynthesis